MISKESKNELSRTLKNEIIEGWLSNTVSNAYLRLIIADEIIRRSKNG